MSCGLTKTDFMVRVGPTQYEDALAQPHARPMDFTGRPLKGTVYVTPEGLRTKAALSRWVRRGLSFVARSGTNAKGRPAKSASKSPRSAAPQRRRGRTRS
jgi:hypothetical protein